MDSTALVQGYMDKYHTLVKEKDELDITGVIYNLNEAIRNNDMQRANEAYSKILGWNFKVANLQGERDSLNKHIHGQKLPSVNMFAVTYDETEKVWKFNA